jgi:hypothetical protein
MISGGSPERTQALAMGLGGMGGFEPPFRRLSSGWPRRIEWKVPSKIGKRGLARLRLTAAILRALVVDGSACSGFVDRGFVDAGMDSNHPPPLNIRHDITPMLGRMRSD